MVTAILPPLTDESDDPREPAAYKPTANARYSAASDLTITPERYRVNPAANGVVAVPENDRPVDAGRVSEKPAQLAGYVGLFTGCGALVALSVFLPLPARFGEIDGVTPAEAITDTYRVVGVVAFAVAAFVFVGLRNLKGEEGKGWRVLLGLKRRDDGEGHAVSSEKPVLPYIRLLRESVTLGFSDSQIALGYLGGFVARASTVAISLFIPLFVNTYFISNGFCKGSPHDPSPELKKECRSAYILASILSGVAQLFGLICAPVFGYVSRRQGRVNYPLIMCTVFGIIGYIIFPRLASPEFRDIDGRGGGPAVFVVVALLGISQIGAIVCSLGSLGRGVLTADLPRAVRIATVDESTDALADGEEAPLLDRRASVDAVSRVRLKGSIAGVYSWCGGAAILILTKLGGYLFDSLSVGAPFYMMALFNGALLAASLAIDTGRAFGTTRR